MTEELDRIVEELKDLAGRMPTTGDMVDIDMAIMYLRHAKKRLENREATR